MKNVLMICYAFPPIAGSGVQRSLYFAKYLPMYGYRPHVVCGSARAKGGLTDAGQLDEVSGNIERLTLPCIEPSSLFRAIGRFCGQLGRYGNGVAWRLGSVNDWVEGLLSPDALLPWALWYAGRVATWARSHRVSLVYSTSDPYSDHLLAWLVCRRLGVPWVADFRDLWTTDWMYSRKSTLAGCVDESMERRVLRDADAVVSVTDGYCKEFRRLLPESDKTKVHLIRNGVDMFEFPDPVRSHRQVLMVSYIGIMYESRWSDAFLRAVDHVNQSKSPPDQWKWVVAGKMSKAQEKKAASLGKGFDYRGYVSAQEARMQMVESDLLLIQVVRGANAKGNVPGKLYEYLASGRPILCLQPEGVESETATLIRKHSAGYVCCMEDQAAIEQVLREVAARKAAGDPVRGAAREDVEQYDRCSLTRQLAEVFTSVVRGSG